MGWFGRGKSDQEAETAGTPAVQDTASGIDFSAYNLSSLGDDVASIINVPEAVGRVAKYSFAIPAVVGIVSWIVFSGRMPTWVLVPFVFGAVVLSLFAAVAIGGLMVVRRRLDTVAQATDRVVGVVGTMHSDIVELREGHANTSVQEVAVGLFENAILPAAFSTFSGIAENSLGPVGGAISKATQAPMHSLVKKSVVAAIRSLPDREIGQLVEDTAGAMPEVGAALAAVNAEYQRTRENVEAIVAKVSRTAVGSMVGVALVATVPLLVWLLIGFVAS